MGKLLSGKCAVVTGGGSAGIGGAVSILLASEGAGVVVNDVGRRPNGKDSADEVVSEIIASGGSAVASHESITTMEGANATVNMAIKNFGKLDILVNVAGNYFTSPISEMTTEQWDSIMDVHLRGTFNMVKAAIPIMIKQKSGRIINFSSRGGFHGPKIRGASYSNLAYNTAKAGIIGFTWGLANELIDNGITVNAILPSAITPLFPSEKRVLTDNIPIPANTGPEYVAPIIAYLATDAAAKITGKYIYACGGDICVFGRPMQLPGPHTFIRKNGMWSIEELNDIMPQILGLNE